MMQEQKIEFWVCRSGGGQTCIFTDKPIRDNVNKIWCGTILGSLNVFLMTFNVEFPVMKWEDDPKKMIITIKF